MATPILTSIGSLNALTLLDTTVLFEVESTTEGSKKLTLGELSNFIVTAVGSELISYSLPVATTTGAADLNNGQVFVVDEGTGPRTVTLTVPTNAVDRSFVYVLKVIGNNAVDWPSEIDWVDETAPILASGYTIVNLLYIDGGWIGNVLIAKDSTPPDQP